MINLHYTEYRIIKKVARELGYRLKRTDLSNGNCVPPTLYAALDNYQYNGSFYPVEKPFAIKSEAVKN